MVRRIALVSCSAEKLSRMAPARQLYSSQLFRKSALWVEQQGLEWFVLSAAYGLIKPVDVLMPYDKTLRNMGPADRQAWARNVAEQLDAYTSEDERVEIVVLAGEAYLQGWPELVAPFATVEQPLRGKQIGERLQWLTQQLGTDQPAPSVAPVQEDLFA